MPKTQTIIAADAGDLAVGAAELFKAAARAHVDQRGRFVVALSGGSTPRGMHRLLASPPVESTMVVAVKGGIPNVGRITLTYPVLNRARQIVFLVAGREKAETVKALMEGARPEFPAARIKPFQGDVIWILDQEAASFV